MKTRPTPHKTRARALRVGGCLCAGFIVFISIVLFVPPIRDRFFSINLFPWSLPDEVTAAQLKTVQDLAQPGDVIIESNMHYWQWVALSHVFTGSTWVHASLVDNQKHIITMQGKIEVLPISIYGTWRSTKLALIRPPYASSDQVQKTIEAAQSHVGTPYDPWFRNPNASCTGIVGESLSKGGIPVHSIEILGRRIFGAGAFFDVPGARVVWTTDQHSLAATH